MTEDEARARVISAMCPTQVCRVCGLPSRRIVEPTPEYAARANAGRDFYKFKDRTDITREVGGMSKSADSERWTAQYVTVGWTDCGHGDWRPGVVLDPFR